MGPWALELGPKTPVTINWAFGQNAASKPKNGIEPPSPCDKCFLPKYIEAASSKAFDNQELRGGQFQPFALPGFSNVTSASYGGLFVNNYLNS